MGRKAAELEQTSFLLRAVSRPNLAKRASEHSSKHADASSRWLSKAHHKVIRIADDDRRRPVAVVLHATTGPTSRTRSARNTFANSNGDMTAPCGEFLPSSSDHWPVFADPGQKPFADQAKHAPVADAMLLRT